MILFMNVHVKDATESSLRASQIYAAFVKQKQKTINTGLYILEVWGANQASGGLHDQTCGDLLYEVRFTSKTNISSTVNIV